MIKYVGIIGISGRMGTLLASLIQDHDKIGYSYELGTSFGRAQPPALSEVFKNNDCVVDFSSAELTKELLEIAQKFPKPLVICTTGWDRNELDARLQAVAKMAPLVIASNTSIGANVQRYLATQVAKILDQEYDIDILEKHHKGKIDSPSGTAVTLLQSIQEAKQQQYGLNYQIYNPISDGKRPNNSIGINAQRSGNVAGEHEVSFTSSEELISIKHVVFNRMLFAKGAMKIIDWLNKMSPANGIYNMADVLELTKVK